MLTTLECSRDGTDIYLLVGLGLVGYAIHLITYLSGNLLAGAIGVCEPDCLQTVGQYFIREIATEGCGMRTERQHAAGTVALAADIRHRDAGLKIIKPLLVVSDIVGQYHRNLDTENSVGIGRHIALGHALGTVAKRAIPPPCGQIAHHRIVHLGSLHGNTGIALYTTTQRDRIAILILLLHLIKLDKECRTLVGFYAERGDHAVVCPYGVVTHQFGSRQREVYSRRAETVGSHLLLSHNLVVGIAQLYLDRLPLQSLGTNLVVALVGYQRHVDGLPRTVDSPVCKQIRDILSFRTVFAIREPTQMLQIGCITVGIRIGP